MRILHTSDWHLGKKLEERPRFSEQKNTLESLVDVAVKNLVDVVVIAGDVFDTFTPPADAEKLFFDTLSQLTAAGIAVVAISGNHDDPTRLSASEKLSVSGGVYFSGGTPFVGGKFSGRVKPLFGGADHVAFEDNSGERVYFALLPYPTEARMKEAVVEDETYDEKISRYIAAALENNCENYPCVLAAHVFMLGGMPSSSERPIELGGARMVSENAIPENVVYTALGHLHKRQVVNKERNIIYSGSILQNAFDECGYEKSVTVFDVIGGNVENLRVIELGGYLKLQRLEAESYERAKEVMSTAPDTYVELTLTLSEPLSSEMIKWLVTSYPKVILRMRVLSGERDNRESRKQMSDEQLFIDFYRSLYGGNDPDERLLSLFLRLINEIDEVTE